MDLETALQEGKQAMNLFFNNQFNEAWDLLKPWIETSMYHSMGNSMFLFLEAIATFDLDHIKKASVAIETTVNLCKHNRRKNTLTGSLEKLVMGANYDRYSATEIHAELCYAETLLLKAILTFIEGETLICFIKAGMKIKSSFNVYKECLKILNAKQWENEYLKVHFESGVRAGIAAYNLMISFLPSTIIKVFEFVGISGSREVGMEELIKCYNLPEGLRHCLSVLGLLTYNLILVYVISHRDGDLRLCAEIIDNQLSLYPRGMCFLFFKGRIEFVSGNINEARHWYVKAWRSQSFLPQFHHVCFWDLLWMHVISQNWDEASEYAEMLLNESKWSRTVYSYQKAAIMLMRPEQLSTDHINEVNKLMKDVPKFKQTFSGKSLALELFCIRKSQKYFSQNNNLVLPIFELAFVLNLFKIIGKNNEICVSLYRTIETISESDNLRYGKRKKSESQDKDTVPESGRFSRDDLALISLLKGASLHQMKNYSLAEKYLKNVLALKNDIDVDTYLVPFALVELALLYYDRDEDVNRSIQILEDAKRNYSGYSLESELHFKIHSALTEFNEIKSFQQQN